MGYHQFTQKDFHAIYHFWRVIGYCLGTEDEFNLCNGSDEEVVEMCRQIYHYDCLPKIRKCAERYPMSSAIIKAFYGHVFPFNYSSIMHYVAPLLGLDISLYPLTTFKEWFNYHMLKFTMEKMYQYTLFTKLANRNSKKATTMSEKKQRSIVKKLKKQYPDISFTLETYPFVLDSNAND